MATDTIPDPINTLGLTKTQAAHLMALLKHHKANPSHWVDTTLDAELPLDAQRFYKMGEDAEKHPSNRDWRVGKAIKGLVEMGLIEATNRSRVMFWRNTAWVVRLSARGVLVAQMMGAEKADEIQRNQG